MINFYKDITFYALLFAVVSTPLAGLYGAVIVFGIFVFWKLPVRELPAGIQPPVVQVQVDYASAAAPISVG